MSNLSDNRDCILHNPHIIADYFICVVEIRRFEVRRHTEICEENSIRDGRYYWIVCVYHRETNEVISYSSTSNKNGINQLIAQIIVYQGPNEKFDELGGQ